MTSELAAAFSRNNEANLFLLDAIPNAGLAKRYGERTRTVAAQFAHIHNVRIYHLDGRGRAFLEGLNAFERGAQPPRVALAAALAASSRAIEEFLIAAEAAGKVKGWNGPPAGFFGYLVAHEAHHRALAILTLRLQGPKLPREIVYNIWDWGRKGPLKGAAK